MDTIETARAAVTGARHLRTARNGQDAVAVWLDGADPLAVAVVCDGCSSGASSEVGARLGAGRSPADPSLWAAARAEVLCAFTDLLERMPGERAAAIHDHLLFTIV